MGLVASCLLPVGAAAFLLLPRFETHPEAVGYVLKQHGIAYEQIRLSHTWPDTMNRRAYGADVIVRLRGAQRITGRIDCKVERSQCLLYLRRLGIWREPVPDLVITPPWLARLQRSLSSLAAFARGLLGS
jgi:hypothetical protein